MSNGLRGEGLGQIQARLKRQDEAISEARRLIEGHALDAVAPIQLSDLRALDEAVEMPSWRSGAPPVVGIRC